MILASVAALMYDALMGYRDDSVTGRLRAAVNASGHTRYALSKATGISQSTLSRFVRGIGVLNAEAIDTLADYLGLTLKAKVVKPTKGR